MRKLGIYIHIPFCVKKCRYCDFLSFPASEEKKQEYVYALLKEMEREAVYYKDFMVDSVFIGGGTPSVLPEGALEEIMNCLRRFYRFPPVSDADTAAGAENGILRENTGKIRAENKTEPEITIEVNPGTVNRKKLEGYRKAGVNRISIGTQSVHGKELAYLGRIHNAADFFRTYQDAQEAGFTNINVDIMAALPGQSVEDHMDNLTQIAGLKPAHISAYSLIIEEGTPFYELYGEKGRAVQERKAFPEREAVPADSESMEAGRMDGIGNEETVLPLPSEEEEREMYERTDLFLKEMGYHRYEISNYAMPGKECRHNVGYWKRRDYAGFGLGASSMADNVRWKNLRDMEGYIDRILRENKSVREEISRLDIQEQMEEFMFLGLRLTQGIGRTEFRETFGRDIEEVYGPVMKKLCGQGLLETGDYISLTPYGRDVSNYVMAEFLF